MLPAVLPVLVKLLLYVVLPKGQVVIHGLEEDGETKLLTELGKEKAVLHIEDISNDGAPERLVELAIKTFGKLDAVVNNAAMVASSNIHTTDKLF